MKDLIFILDGAADEINPSNGLTPLEEAKTPTFDVIAKNGIIGRVQTIPNGFQAGTDIAMSTLFGATERALSEMGRASIEAIDIPLQERQSIARVNFLSINENQCILHYFSSDSDSEEQQRIITDLLSDFEFQKICIKYYIQFIQKENTKQAFVVYPKSDFSCISPLKCIGEPYLSFAADFFEPIQAYSRLFLQNHSINKKRQKNKQFTFDILWPWGDGKRPALWDFPKRYQKTMAMISETLIIQGLATVANMDCIANDNCSWQKYDVLFFHIEEIDTFSHEGNRLQKIKAIEEADAQLSFLLNQLAEKPNITIMTDHYTICQTKQHAEYPVPFIYCNWQEKDKNKQQRFCEKDAQNMPIIMGHDYFDTLFKKGMRN